MLNKMNYNILSIGELKWQNCFEYSIQAINTLIQEGFRINYSIVGDGDYLDALSYYRHLFDLEKYISFIRNIDKDTIPFLLNITDLVLTLNIENDKYWDYINNSLQNDMVEKNDYSFLKIESYNHKYIADKIKTKILNDTIYD